MAYSANGEYAAAAGYKVAPGPAGAEVNGSVYLFNKNGQMEWSISSPEPIFAVDINGNGSVIMTSDSVLLYINNQGKVLWNYSKYGPTVGALVDNGSSVIAGISMIPFANHSSFGSSLTMFDAKGNVVWNVSLPDQLFDSTSSLALSDGYIAAGLSNTGYNGTLNYYNMQGKLIWSKNVDSAILGVNFTSNQSAILVETNWGHDTFDLSGNVIQNQTAPHSTD